MYNVCALVWGLLCVGARFSACKHSYVCMYVYVCPLVREMVNACVYAVCIYVYLNGCLSVWVRVSLDACARMSVCICAYLCLYVKCNRNNSIVTCIIADKQT